METGHDRADDLRDVRRRLRLWLRIGTAQRDKSVTALQFLRLGQTNAELLGNLLRDGMASHRNVSGKETIAFRKQQRGAPSANIKDNDAAIVAEAIRPGGVEARDRRDVDALFPYAIRNQE